jgi:hypothetical protein
MQGCLGFIGAAPGDAIVAATQSLTDGHVLPLPGGALVIFTRERYELLYDTLLRSTLRRSYRFIFTVGDFNAAPQPAFYDLYAQFAITDTHVPGDYLICAETYAKNPTQFRIYPTADYLPLALASLRVTPNIYTPFGEVAQSPVWYTPQAVGLVAPHDRLEFMTRGSEIAFWYSAAGFLYLAHQAFLIKTYHNHPRRILIFSRADLRSDRFTKLAFLFAEFGIDTILLFDEDVDDFLSSNDLQDIDIFSRAGANTFLKRGGVTYVSEKTDVAERVAEAQSALVSIRGAHPTVEAYMTAYQAVINGTGRAAWERRARTAKSLFEQFAILPPAIQRTVLETYIERWRSI